METVARILLAAVLAWSAAAKLADARRSTAAMATFGFATPASRRLAWTIAVVAEVVLAIGVAAGSDRAAYLAAALLALFALTLGSALMRGRAGAPCACFGGGTTVGRRRDRPRRRACRRVRDRPGAAVVARRSPPVFRGTLSAGGLRGQRTDRCSNPGFPSIRG